MTSAVVERDAQSGWTDPAESRDASPPLVIDLDGTCVKTNIFLEYLLALLRQYPFYLFLLPIWRLRGEAYLTEQVARRAPLDVSLLPYRKEFLNYLEMQRVRGRTIILINANDSQITRQIADYLMLFDTLSSRDRSSGSQRDRLVLKFGEKNFDYATCGRTATDIVPSARKVILVHPGRNARTTIPRVAEVERVFEDRDLKISDYFTPLRPKHWLKNLLVFVPVFAAHRFYEGALLAKSLVAFVAVCCCASSGYLFNDLFDLAADRHHPRKRSRLFAAGDLPLSYALVMILGLVVLGCILGAWISPRFILVLLTYFALTLTYTLFIKKIVLLDVIVLAGLYTLRIVAGSAAVNIWPSPWLLAFSIFFFLSLALVKRYSELVVMRKTEGDKATARGYEISDAELLAAKGTASGYLAVFVLALYIASGRAEFLYGRHQLIWFLCPLMLYWIGRMWLVAHRGQMNDDPVLFATTDWTSRILILLMIVTTVLAL
jgi:4-hydroxybenzoate polyprenyltransferase